MNEKNAHTSGVMKQAAFYLFLFTLLFSPLAFGTVEAWSYLVMESAICVSALLLVFSAKNAPFYRAPGLAALMAVNAFLLFQLLPLPPGVVKLISPVAYAFHQNTALVTGETAWMSLTIYPRATVMELLRFSAYTVFYVAAVQFFTNSLLLKKTVAVIAGFAAVLSLITIIGFVTRSLNYPLPHDKIFWVRELTHGGTPVGPYVNRNHYAGLMVMVFPMVLALFLAYRPMVSKISFKRKIADFLSQKRVNHHLFYGTAAVLIGTSVFLSLSRGGIISLSVSMIIFSALLIFRIRQKKAGYFIGVVVLLVLLLTGSSGWDSIYQRFENLRAPSGEINLNRFVYWKDSIDIIGDFTLAGTGTGTFEKIYPLYRTDPGEQVLEHAHSDYLEFLSTGGIVLPALMGWCLFSILFSAARTFAKRREWYCLLLFTGCATSVSAILLHSLVDFNMQVGANGLYFFLVLALAVSSATTRMRPGLNATYLSPAKVSFFPAVAAVFLLLAAVLYTHGGSLAADHYLKDYRNMTIAADMPREKILNIHQAAKTGGAWDILHPRYANISANTASFLSKDADAVKYHARAIRLDPINSRYLMDAAAAMRRQGNHDAAENLFFKSIQYGPDNMSAYLQLAAMLFEASQTEKGLSVLKQAMFTDARITHASLALMVLNHIDDERMHAALPDRVKPHLAFGDFLYASGEKQKAENAYVKALTFLPNEDGVDRRSFLHVARFYGRHHMDEKALLVILKAIDYFPDDHGLRRMAGDLYKGLGIEYRAQEEYRKADMLRGP